MSHSYALITKLLRWLGRILKHPLEAAFLRSSATLIPLILRLCKRFWSYLNLVNPTGGRHAHRRTDPTPPSNAHEPVCPSHLPYLQVQDAVLSTGPSTESLQFGSPLASASGYTGTTARTPDLSDATPSDPVTALPANVLGNSPPITRLDHAPMSTPGANKKKRRGERKGDPSVLPVNDRARGHPREYKFVALTVPTMMYRRYGRKGQADWKKSYGKASLEPGCRDYSDHYKPGWVRYVQAEGAQYFYQPELRVLTDAPDAQYENLLDKVQSAAKSLHDIARTKNIQLSEDTELVIELEIVPKKKKEAYEWQYYFVDHAAHVVFWIDSVELKQLVGHVRGVEHKSHLKYAIETQYWMHREMFPLNRPIPLSVLKSLKATLIYAQAEEITSNTSLAPFDVDELGNLIDLVDKMEDGALEGQSDIIFVIARLIRFFTEAKFVNFYGQIGARLNADQSVYSGEDHKQSAILPVLDVFLFGAASAHLKTLKGIWVDRTVTYPRWKGFIRKLLAEWNSFTIYSTVMLAVDVSFLGNPGMQLMSTGNVQQRGGLTAIYLSLVCVVGSLLVSVFLVGQARGQEGESAQGAADFMKRMTHSMLGLEALAIMQSVPYALLIWGMLFFVLAIAFVIFASNDSVIIAIISPAWVLVALLCMWPLWGSRQRRASLHKMWKIMVERLPSLPLPSLKKKAQKPPLPTDATPPPEE